MLDLTVILPVRNAEPYVTTLARQAAAVGRSLTEDGALDAPARFEIVLLDERSGDNTLAHVSLLHGQIPELRTVQDVEPGRALARAARVAQGSAWLVLDHPVADDLARWAAAQVARGQVAAMVPGEVLALTRDLGVKVLGPLRGGLVAAQRAVRRATTQTDSPVAFSPAPRADLRSRAVLRARAVASRLGLARLDRPRVFAAPADPDEPRGGSGGLL